MIPTPSRVGIALLSLSLLGCQSMYYGTMEKFGIQKKSDILIDRVEEARKAQQDAKEQFESALDQFLAVTNYRGGELEAQYRKLKGEYEDSLDRAEAVRERIEDVETVAEDLFAEWKAELAEYRSAELRRSSERQLKSTRHSYSQLIRAMKRAESKLDPVLGAFNDRVLYLKHNLNAQAIAALKSDRAAIESDIKTLVSDMNKSIAEADRFISTMSAE